MIRLLCRLAIACCLAATLCLGAVPTRAVETGAGTKNFSPPSGVPDHFSNETEPFIGESAAPGPALRGKVSGAPRVRGGAVRGRLAHGGRHGRGRVATRHVMARGGHAVHASRHAAVPASRHAAVHASRHAAVPASRRAAVPASRRAAVPASRRAAVHASRRAAVQPAHSHTAVRRHVASARRRG